MCVQIVMFITPRPILAFRINIDALVTVLPISKKSASSSELIERAMIAFMAVGWNLCLHLWGFPFRSAAGSCSSLPSSFWTFTLPSLVVLNPVYIFSKSSESFANTGSVRDCFESN